MSNRDNVRDFPRAFKPSYNEGQAPMIGGPGGGDGNMLEARVAKLEATAAHIDREMADVKENLRELRRDSQRDFRITWGGIIAVALGLAGLLAKGFGWL